MHHLDDDALQTNKCFALQKKSDLTFRLGGDVILLVRT